MSRAGVSSPKNKICSSNKLNPNAKKDFHRFIGISLSGAKSDKTSLVVLEYYYDQDKIFLTHVHEKIKTEDSISSDQKIVEIINKGPMNIFYIGFDLPLSLPVCIFCKLKCPGYEKCQVEEIKWMRKNWEDLKKKKRKPRKIFTPYSQRCVDAYLQNLEPIEIDIQDSMGSNLGPLTLRAMFLKKRLSKYKCIEVSTKLSVWRFGNFFKMNKSTIRGYRHSINGEECRKIFLEQLSEKMGVFFYQQDLKHLVDNLHSFEALVCGLVAILKYKKNTLSRPKSLPKREKWVSIPNI